MPHNPKPNTILRHWERYKIARVNPTHQEHAIMMGLPYSVYMARLNEAIMLREKQPPFSLGAPLKLAGDWLITGDWHIPFTDLDWANLVWQVGEKHLPPPRRLLIAGDLINFDLFSSYPHLTQLPTWAQERDMARALFAKLMEIFDEVVVLMGNHERRGQKATLGAFDETDIISLIVSNPERVRSTPFGYCVIDTPAGAWRITHPKNYSINQLGVADNLAWKYEQHIIGFHEHHLSVGWDRFGRYVVINGGSMVDPDKLAYVTLDDSKAAAMKNGFVMLKNGTPYLFGREPFTDWSRWI